MVHTSGRHALVLGVNKDRAACWREAFCDRITNLRCHGFLRLETLRKNLDNARELGNADDGICWLIRDIGFAKEWRHMVLTMAFNVDFAKHDEVVIALNVIESA